MSDLREGINPRKEATFTLGNRIRRVIWNLAYAILFRPSPRPCHAWRSAILRLFGAEIGRGCHIYPKVKIWAPWNLDVHDEGSAADDVTLYSMAKITIGKRAIVSQGAHLCTGTHDYTDPNFQLIAIPITIGEEAWVCTEAFIGPGVTVGAGAVIGARAVATKDQPEWMVCAGNPCKPLRPREMRA